MSLYLQVALLFSFRHAKLHPRDFSLKLNSSEIIGMNNNTRTVQGESSNFAPGIPNFMGWLELGTDRNAICQYLALLFIMSSQSCRVIILKYFLSENQELRVNLAISKDKRRLFPINQKSAKSTLLSLTTSELLGQARL